MTPSAFWKFLVLIPALADLPTADVETLKAGRHTGQFVQMSDSAVRLLEAGAQVDLPLADVLEIRFTSQNVPDPALGPRVVLIDGTRICRRPSNPNSRASASTWSTSPSSDESNSTPTGGALVAGGACLTA